MPWAATTWKMKSLVLSVTSALQLDRCDYQVRINGQEKKVITYSDVGRNTYSMRFILGKDTHNEPDDRPAIEFRREDGEIVPVFRGTISRVRLMPINDAELEKSLDSVNVRSVAKQAAGTFVIGVVALAVAPFLNRAFDWVLAALLGVISSLNAAIPEGRGTLARRFAYEHVPCIDPANNHFFQLVLDYKIITLPLIAAVMMVGFKLVEPMMSRLWIRVWSKVTVAKYL